MRSIILSIVTATLLLSCSRHEQDHPIGSGQVNFSTVTSLSTRGIITTGDSGANPLMSLGVFAFHGNTKFDLVGAPNYMNNIHIKRLNTTSGWGYPDASDIRYWIPNGYHSFLSYAPYGSVTPVKSTPLSDSPDLALSYTVATSVVEQKDLLYSSKTVFNGTEATHKNSPVIFGMSHALTKITFDVVLGPGYAGSPIASFGACKLKSLSFTNLYIKGTLRYILGRSGGAGSDIDKVNGITWLFDGTSLGAPLSATIGKGLSDLTLSTTAQTVSSEEDGAWFLLPQILRDRPDGLKPSLEAEFEFVNGKKHVVSYDLGLITEKWTPAQAIRYTITYNGGSLPSSLTGVVVPWTDQEIDGSLRGTYLNLSQPAEKIVKEGTSFNVHYSSDYSGAVSGTLFDGVNTHILVDQGGYFTISGSLIKGDYTLKITAGNITRSIIIKVQ